MILSERDGCDKYTKGGSKDVRDLRQEQESLLEPGSVKSSVLNLIAATMGAGTITMPYIICLSGIGLGAILTTMGAALS